MVQQVSGKGPVRMSKAPQKFGLDGAYSAFPGVGRVPSGRLVLAWRQGSDHVTSRDGYIRTSYSDDDGRNWSTPITAVPNPGGGIDIRDADVAASADGSRVWLTYFKGTNALAAAGCFLRTSTDGGQTWGTESRIDNAPYAALTGPIVELDDGTLLQPWYGRTGSETRDSSFVARSTNDGAAWTQIRVANGQSAARDYQEPWLTLCGSTLVMLFRWNNAESIGISRSTDGGLTWTAPAVTFTPGTGRPAAVYLSTGVLVCIYRRLSDGAAIYRSSLDLGATWLTPRTSQIVTGSGWMTYAAPVEVAAGLAFCVVGIESTNGAVSALWNSYIADGGGISPLGDFPDAVTRLITDQDLVLAADNFDRTDSASGLGYALTGQPWSAGGRIEAGTGRSVSADNVPEFPVINAGSADVTVEADLWWSLYSGHGLILRFKDDSNHLLYTVEGDGANVRLYVRNAGTYYKLSEAGSVPVAGGQYRRFTAVLRGNRFLGSVDGQLVLAYTIGQVDMDLLGAQTRHGIKFNESSTAQHRCRRFLVRA